MNTYKSIEDLMAHPDFEDGTRRVYDAMREQSAREARMLLVVIGFVALAFWGAVAVGLVTFVRMVIKGVGG